MAAPGIPTNFYAQTGNGQVYLSWTIQAGATSYDVQRSTDGVAYSSIGTATANNYLDTTASLNTLYYYKVASSNGETSGYTAAQQAVPTMSGVDCLASLRLQAQQRADRVNSNFVTMPEWNTYINQSMLELYDLLVTVYEDYYKAPDFVFQTTGDTNQYQLPNGIITDIDGAIGKPFYKLLGVDMGIAPNTNNARVTVHKYDFIERNRYIYPNINSTYFGVFNMRYRIMGDKIHFIPVPSGAQYITLHYIPRLATLLQDTDVCDGVSGWTEYIIVDAAIKALQKEESDVSVLYAQKQALIDRIQSSAMNRDAGAPDTISDSRAFSGRSGRFGYGGDDGSFGGF